MALVSLLAFWALAILVAPRLAPAVAATLYPPPSAPELDLDASDDLSERLDRGQPTSGRPERLRQLALEKYGVRRIEDLPVNLSGFLLEYAEEQSTAAYREQFATVYRRYAQQDAAQLWFAWLSPLPALRAWSAAMAGTDVVHHRRFLEAAENYRHAFVQALNRDILQHRPPGGSSSVAYRADVAKITAGLGEFTPPAVPLADVWARAWPSLAALAAWAGSMTVFAARAAGTLARLT
jgi:ABC-2 type transport system permease protein